MKYCPCTIQYSPTNLCLSSLVKWLKGDKNPDRELQWNNQAINRTKYYPKHGETKHTLCNQYFPCLRYSLGICPMAMCTAMILIAVSHIRMPLDLQRRFLRASFSIRRDDNLETKYSQACNNRKWCTWVSFYFFKRSA